ncbi:MAG TPA: molybdopterin cofactor-binding domain-containing protein, partial [Fimbriimonadaceae bacterium]|nr:molybdopterin cofactor-binding domain-containing protein [Fimbriimonadaceae bacterium]
AAAAREALMKLAAEKWHSDPAALRAEHGRVMNGSASASYGDLAKGQKFDQEIATDVALTSPSDWKVLGASLKKVDAIEIVTGRHRYASDMTRPGMLYGKVLRPPSFGAVLGSFDASAAKAMTGVEVVHLPIPSQREGEQPGPAFVAVAAPTLRGAQAALDSIKAVWSDTAGPSNADLPRILRTSEPTSTTSGRKNLKATYTCAHIAHVPLEPRAALADWDGKKMTVYTGTQRPFAVKDEVVQATGLPAAQVRVIVPDTGSGYGGKHTGEAATEAARIALAVGKPVRVVWTREEEMTWAYFRPAGIADVSSGVDADGKLTGWTHDNYNSGPAGIGTPYDVSDKREEFHEANSPLRQGSYRSLAACFNNFARETHMDEVAHMLGEDPLEFRMKNLADERLKDVLKAAADKFGWGSAKAASGHGFGIACGIEKGGRIATAIEVAVEGSTPRLLRAVTAFDCGAVLNPDLLKNQVDGALIMGIGGALFESIRFADGKILNAHLSEYRVPRYEDVPAIETVLVDRKDQPSAGAGETPIMAIAPAIGNAIFAATGKRLRDMPLTL